MDLKPIHLYLDGNRLNHSLMVRDKMLNIIPDNLKHYEKELELASLYHDIGYSEVIKDKTGNHNIDGYYFIRDKVCPVVAYMVLMHSNGEGLSKKKGMQDIFDKAKSIAWFLLNIKEGSALKLHTQEMVNLLSYCDLTTNSKGESVTTEERLQDIEERYGVSSPEYIVIKKEISKLELIYKD